MIGASIAEHVFGDWRADSSRFAVWGRLVPSLRRSVLAMCHMSSGQRSPASPHVGKHVLHSVGQLGALSTRATGIDNPLSRTPIDSDGWADRGPTPSLSLPIGTGHISACIDAWFPPSRKDVPKRQTPAQPPFGSSPGALIAAMGIAGSAPKDRASSGGARGVRRGPLSGLLIVRVSLCNRITVRASKL